VLAQWFAERLPTRIRRVPFDQGRYIARHGGQLGMARLIDLDGDGDSPPFLPAGLPMPIVKWAAECIGVEPFVLLAFEEVLGCFACEEVAAVRALPIPVLREVASHVAEYPTLRDRLWRTQFFMQTLENIRVDAQEGEIEADRLFWEIVRRVTDDFSHLLTRPSAAEWVAWFAAPDTPYYDSGATVAREEAARDWVQLGFVAVIPDLRNSVWDEEVRNLFTSQLPQDTIES
jgi:hypothetical protein